MNAPHPAERKPVVAGVDGSDTAIRAAVHAAGWASRRGAPLLLVHATPWGGLGAHEAPTEDIRRLLVDGATDVVERASEAVREATGLTDVGTRVLDGRPVEALRAVTAEAEVLVLGARGAGAVGGLLLGSTAHALVGHAECPVVVLPESAAAVTRDRRTVVVAVEGRPDDADVLALAFTEAALRGTDLLAVHAWRDMALETAFRSGSPLVDWAGVVADEERLLAESLAGWAEKEPDVEVRELVVRERAAPALLAAAMTAELLVVGHRHRTVLPRLGSTTYGVLHGAPCPVAVVPLTARSGR